MHSLIQNINYSGISDQNLELVQARNRVYYTKRIQYKEINKGIEKMVGTKKSEVAFTIMFKRMKNWIVKSGSQSSRANQKSGKRFTSF